MAFFSEIDEHVTRMRDLLGEELRAEDLVETADDLSDAGILEIISAAGSVRRLMEQVEIVAAGVVAARSTRDAGHAGFAQSRGHSSPVSFLQEMTGSSRVEAQKQVRLGASLRESASQGTGDEQPNREGPGVLPQPWHASLGAALLAGTLSSAQHDAILRGLGAPTDETDDAREAWRVAAEQLALEARERTVEELGSAARAVRDRLDPDGAERRFLERFERRSFRTWRDRDGIKHASWVFDDEGAAFLEAVHAAALRPRLGPRFVDETEKAQADDLTRDPRSNEQLAYDLMLDIIRAGVLAEPKNVFGTRQAGVRLVATSAPPWRRRSHRSHRGRIAHRPGGCGRATDLRKRNRGGDRRLLRESAQRRQGAQAVHSRSTCRSRHPRRRMPLARLRPSRLVL